MNSSAPRAPSIGGIAAPADAVSPDVLVAFRYLFVILVIVGALGVCVWTRMAVRGTAVELGSARSQLAREQARHERLLVERAVLRVPGRLQDMANGMALVTPAEVVTLHPVAESVTP